MADSLSLCRENFASFTEMLGGAPDGAYIRLADGSAAGASGLDSAGDSYALFAPGASATEAAIVVGFFDGGGFPFMVPLFPENGAALGAELARRGLTARGFHTAMSLSLAGTNFERGGDTTEASSESEVREWTETTWRGFGGEGAPDAAYTAFSRYMAQCAGNRLFFLRDEGRAVCAGLLLKSANTVGLYYFAAPPEYRRRGYARLLLRALAFEAAKEYGELVLLATEAGRPAYESFGFETLASITMMGRGAE